MSKEEERKEKAEKVAGKTCETVGKGSRKDSALLKHSEREPEKSPPRKGR